MKRRVRDRREQRNGLAAHAASTAPGARGIAGAPGDPGALRLITIPISHYCEKARWALERAGLAYREQRHVQAIHRIAARRAGAGPTVPVLLTPQGVLGESELILVWVDQRTPQQHRLFPAEPAARAAVLALCRRFDEVLGPRGRRLIYVHMLAQPRLALQYNNQGVPSWEDRAVRVCFPLVARFIERELGITEGVQAQDEAAVFGELDHAAALLGDGRPYLCGEHFSAADLTFAALSASVLAPPQYGVALPQPDLMAPATAALVRRARTHPAGRFALDLFARHRSSAVGGPVSADRLGG